MIKPDWNIFRANFNENTQSNFEWFCYLLFCQEFKKPQGIFRYKNQAGIETNPIIIDKEVIGWQAKFYDSTLSVHNDDIIGTITKGKRDYPTLTKIIFYTNQEWGQGKSQNDPQAKIEAEELAKTEGIKIEWRTASYFDSPFVSIENASLAQHFFSLSKSIIDLLNEKQDHTENILYEIHTDIDLNGQKIEIDRGGILQRIKEELNQKQILIISGVGGVGKTAIIKKLYEEIKNKIPLYIFKSNEFNINQAKDLFEDYSLQDFIRSHREELYKIMVIDSAEKLLDLQNTDPFKEFISVLFKNDWKIIFTARSSYLLDLDIQFIDNYQITPSRFNIENLKREELENLSQSYNFTIPKDPKLIDLIRNPFYLNEYLKFYEKGEDIDYSKFKEKLWNKIIKKAKPSRDQCFLQISHQRAEEGQFYIIPNLDSQILNELVQDGILGYATAGYFITHDIYEEWALEKTIESKFIKKSTNESFFNDIGSSLPIRRAFRNWISEKLLIKNLEIKPFIEEVIDNNQIVAFWQDEILVAVLLSNYSEAFFELFNEKLLEDNQNLLKRITFLLRIACKEVDAEFFKQLGIVSPDLFSVKYVLTKPTGTGWDSLITFVYRNFDKIGVNNINFVLPLILDWNTKLKQGKITKLSSLIALKYYQWTINEDIHFYRNEDLKENILKTILYGAFEIKDELIIVFDEILAKKWKNHSEPYYDLIKMILTKLVINIEVINALPEYVLKLADLFWFKPTGAKEKHFSSSLGVELHFSIYDDRMDYFPASAYQTPLYWLLKSSFKSTIDFIINFTNKTVEHFAKSDFAKYEVEEIDVFLDDQTNIKQWICSRIWNMYRGTQVSPYVLESIHMALEKFFLEIGKITEPAILESWLLYLITNSKSASISAIVDSIVLAYPQKTFNVAKILFRTKEFFFYDTQRRLLDQTDALALLGTGEYGQLFHTERIESNKLKHREMCLENLALTYQFLQPEGVNKLEVENRQRIIWSIFDKYYKELSEESEKTKSDKTWKLYLARMDRRKMKPTIEKKDENFLINFNPEIEPELKEYSEEALKRSSEPMKYTSLKLWASYKSRNDERYKKHEQYENNHQLVLKEVKVIVATLKKSKDESFELFNYSIPGDVCSILVRDYWEKISKKERIFCKDTILKVASSSFRANYQYQIWDGVESAISVLPILLEKFPEDKENIKNILLLTLFDPNSIGMYANFSDYSTKAIVNDLWRISFKDAQSILFGYLLLKPKYEALRDRLRRENYKRQIFSFNEDELITIFQKEYKLDLRKVTSNELVFEDLKNIEKLDLYILFTAFKLIPFKTAESNHKKIVEIIISTFANALLSNIKEEKVDYRIRHSFIEQLSYFVLKSSQQDILIYLKPFIDGFNSSEPIADLFQEFILAEDRLDTYNEFWFVWDLFYEKVIELAKVRNEYSYTDKIIKSYLFAQNTWKETATDWHTLKDAERRFFKKISEKIGNCPSVLYSISKLLYGIGSNYLNEGVLWIAEILNNNKKLWSDKLEVDTVYYLENIAKKYIYNSREEIRRTKKLKSDILVILNFLVEKGYVIGYMLRENIL